MRKSSTILAISFLLLFSSCATLFNTRYQYVKFETSPPGAEVFINGTSINKVTPCWHRVKRKVASDDKQKKNKQHYTFKLNGYNDYEYVDKCTYNVLPLLLNVFIGVWPAALDLYNGAAYKYQRNINGVMNKKEVIRTPAVATTIPKMPKVYAVVIGVSEYKDRTMNLEFADDDARLFYDYLKSPNGGALPDDHITLLLNEKATRANIIKALNIQFKNAFEEDMVIVYIASHGMPSASGNKLYFLGADTDKDNLEGTGVAQGDILDAINNCKAEKKVWIADACHSGGVGLDAGGTRGQEDAANSTMVSRLMSGIADYKKNMILLTASSAGETSQESKLWGDGHGVFTWYLVKGLKGEADAGSDGIVDIREIYEYTRNKVSADTYKKQFPELKGMYKDRFPMSVVK